MSQIFRTWTVALNQAPASNATLQAQASSILRARKNNYVNAGWSVVSSSNGVVFGNNDNVDHWNADADLVWAAGGVAHSWTVLRSPANNPSAGRSIFVLLACSTGAANQHQVNETYSSSQFTGGSLTADPVATANTFRQFNNKQFLRSPVANTHYHAMFNTLGDVLFFTSTDGVGYCAHSSGYTTVINGEANINFPVMIWSSWNDGSPGGMQASSMQGTNSNANWMQDGSIAPNGGVLIYSVNGGTLPSNFNGNQGTIASISTWLLLPVATYIIGTPSGGSQTAGWSGTMVDVSYAPTGPNTPLATMEPNVGPTTTAKFGEYMVPNGGVTPVF